MLDNAVLKDLAAKMATVGETREDQALDDPRLPDDCPIDAPLIGAICP